MRLSSPASSAVKFLEYRTFAEVADEQSVEADFRAACRTLTADLARKYADHLASGDEDDDGLFDAHVTVAALAQVDGVSDGLDREADRIAKRWFAKYRVEIKGLTDERHSVYDEIKGMSPEPQVIEVKRPRIRTEETENDDGTKLETRTGHLMSRRRRQLPRRLDEPVGDTGPRQRDGPLGLPGLVSEPFAPVRRCPCNCLPECPRPLVSDVPRLPFLPRRQRKH